LAHKPEQFTTDFQHTNNIIYLSNDCL